jgi:antitoxin component HigA of HigAB toxin-antitoxin module
MSEPYERLVAEEALILDAQELIVGLMERESLTRVELARKLGKSKGFVSHILSGKRNLTLRTLADCAHVMGYRLTLGVAAPVAPVPGDQHPSARGEDNG